MSEIATLEKLELFLAQVSAPAAPVAPATPQSTAAERESVMANGRQGSQLELFFSEVSYPTFVTKKAPSRPRLREASSSNSSEGALKFSLRLH